MLWDLFSLLYKEIYFWLLDCWNDSAILCNYAYYEIVSGGSYNLADRDSKAFPSVASFICPEATGL
jgi:hypothetical protein